MTGEEPEPGSHPLMAIPLLTFLDRLSVRDDERPAKDENRQTKEKSKHDKPEPTASQLYRSPPLALGVSMLPDSEELANMKKVAEKSKDKEINYFKARTASYSMSFHSQYVDFECWMCRKLPGFSNVDLHTYWGNQHPQIVVGYVPEGVSAKELREKGIMIMKLQTEHETNKFPDHEGSATEFSPVGPS